MHLNCLPKHISLLLTYPGLDSPKYGSNPKSSRAVGEVDACRLCHDVASVATCLFTTPQVEKMPPKIRLEGRFDVLITNTFYLLLSFV